MPKENLSKPIHREMDQLLVCGEVNEGGERYWPTCEQIAQMLSLKPGAVQMFSKRVNTKGRRQSFLVFKHYEVPPFSTAKSWSEIERWAFEQPKKARQKKMMGPSPDLFSVRAEPPPNKTKPLDAGPFREERIIEDEEPYDREVKEKTSKRPVGRPRRSDSIPWMDIDRLLVVGEIRECEDGSTEVHYPTQTEIAGRFGIDQTAVSKYMKEHNCIDRREKAKVRQAIRIEEKIIERRAEGTVVSKERLIAIIDNFTLKFEESLAEGRIRSDSVVDLNTMARLKEFLLGGADSRQEIQGALTLQALQGRYQAFGSVEEEVEVVDTDGTEASPQTLIEEFDPERNVELLEEPSTPQTVSAPVEFLPDPPPQPDAPPAPPSPPSAAPPERGASAPFSGAFGDEDDE